MASVYTRDSRWSVRWRERVGGRTRARSRAAPTQEAAEDLRQRVEHDVAVHGFYRFGGHLNGNNHKAGRYRSRRSEGFIYFIEAAGLVKIGYAANPAKRLVELRCGCPVPMTMLGTIAAPFEVELQWHKQWAALRTHGEWFTLAEDLRSAIAVVCAGCVKPKTAVSER